MNIKTIFRRRCVPEHDSIYSLISSFLKENKPDGSASRKGPRFSWTPEQINFAKESFLWGTIIISIPSGVLAEFLGPFHIIIYATAMSAILNLIRALVISSNYTSLIVMEFMMGMNLGLVLPAVSVWIARWAPPNERGMFVCAHTGGDLGIAVMRVLCRNLVPFLGWRGLYYLSSSKVFLFCIVSFFLGSSSPENHRSISAKELRFIKKSQKGKVTSTRSVPPYGEILYSRAFWAVNILNFGFFWGLSLQLDSTPRFLTDFIGLHRDQVAYMELFPPIGMIGTSILSAAMGDFIRTRNIFPDTSVVKIFVVISHILPGFLILLMTMAYCNGDIIYFLLFLGVSFIGVGNISCRRTTIDIAPNYAGSVFGLIQFSSRSSAIGGFRLADKILQYNGGIIGWTIVFLIGGGCLIGTATIYFFFGTGATQWWNQKSQDRRLSIKPGDTEGRTGLPTHRFKDEDEQVL